MTRSETRTPSPRAARPASIRSREPGRYFQAPAWEWSATGELGWWVRPGWAGALLGPDGLPLEQWRRDGRLHVVKAGPHRVVYRADLPDDQVFIKHFLVPNWRAILRQWFRRGKGRNEARRAECLAAAGVTTITPLALGERRRHGFLFDNFLVTRAIPDMVPLDGFLKHRLPALAEPRRSRVRRRLAESLGELTARLHEGGFEHIDFHPGNVLVRLGDDDAPHLAMIDLDALRVRRRMDWPAARANLALLNHYFWIRSTRTDRQRFLAVYLRGRRSGEPVDARTFARKIEEETRTWAERLWRRWGRRCLGTNKYFRTYQGRSCWAVASRGLAPETVRSLLANPDLPFDDPGVVILKDSRTTTVAEVMLPVQGTPTPVIYKRFNRKKVLDPIYTVFRPSCAWRAWQNGQHLASRGVPTPQNLAVIGRASVSRRLLPHQYWPHDTYLVTIKADPSTEITLGDYVQQVLPALPPERRRDPIRRLTPALARLIRLLHERSLSHRDLKAANILIEGPPEAENVRMSLIDLVGVKLEHPISRHHRVQNLARLQISLATVAGRTRTDALRFLKAYLPWSLAARAEWKALSREVEDACRKKEDQNRRNNRKLS